MSRWRSLFLSPPLLKPDNLSCCRLSGADTTWECGSIRDYLYDTTSANPKSPPIGMRSAVPLGGLGTGTFELRGDGSFADWQIENQGPALATNGQQNSKLPTIQGALLGLRVGDGFATTLQTHPGAGLPAAEALTYSGAYPFSRHALNDSRQPAGVSAEVYSFSAVKMHDENASALPAVAFTLVLENKGDTAVNASFLLTLPLAATASTSRRDTGNIIGKTIPSARSAEVCLKACTNWNLKKLATDPACTYWDLDMQQAPVVPAVPAEKAITMVDHDCSGGDIFQAGRAHGYTEMSQCSALCKATKGCRGFVWDTIQSEVGSQCHGKKGEFCCLMKTVCDRFKPKKGDIAVSLGHPEIPAVPPKPGPGCILHSGAPSVQQFRPDASDASSGVNGVWSQTAGGTATAGPTLVHTRANIYALNSSTLDPASAVGEYSLLAANGADTVSVSSGDTARTIFADFAKDGTLDDGVATAASSGAIAASAMIPPGTTKSLTLVFSWRFPDRNYVGEELGNFYSEIYSSSSLAAEAMASRVSEIASEGAAFNRLFTNSSYPAWFQDFLINSLATQPKMGIWVTKQCPKCGPLLTNGRLPGSTANGRYRTCKQAFPINSTIKTPLPVSCQKHTVYLYGSYDGRGMHMWETAVVDEAFSGCDLDPVHVSDYHQIPYATFYPSLTKNVRK